LEVEVEPLRRWNKRRKPCTIVPPPPILLALRSPRHWLPADPSSYVLPRPRPPPSSLFFPASSSLLSLAATPRGRLLASPDVLIPRKGRTQVVGAVGENWIGLTVAKRNGKEKAMGG
jgi:hypothetical protein